MGVVVLTVITSHAPQQVESGAGPAAVPPRYRRFRCARRSLAAAAAAQANHGRWSCFLARRTATRLMRRARDGARWPEMRRDGARVGAPDSDDAKSLLLCAVAAAAAELPDAALSGCSHARLRCLQRLLNCLASEIGHEIARDRPRSPEIARYCLRLPEIARDCPRRPRSLHLPRDRDRASAAPSGGSARGSAHLGRSPQAHARRVREAAGARGARALRRALAGRHRRGGGAAGRRAGRQLSARASFGLRTHARDGGEGGGCGCSCALLVAAQASRPCTPLLPTSCATLSLLSRVCTVLRVYLQ